MLLTLGNMVSQFGDRVTHMALIAIVGAFQPGSHLAFSAMSVFFTLPVILFGPISGIVADRFPRKGILLVGDFARAALIALLPFLLVGTGKLLSAYAIVFLVFSLTIFFNIARVSLIPDIVPQTHLLTANSVLSFVARIATVIGTVLGGFLVDWLGWFRAFFIDAATYLISFLCILMIALPLQRPTPSPASEDPQTSPLRDLQAAFGYASRDTLVRFILGTVALFGFLSAAAYVLLVMLIQQELGLGTRGVGIAGGLMAVGMILGALALSLVRATLPRKPLILWSLVGFGLLYLAAAVLPITFGAVIVGGTLAGVFTSALLIGQDTVLQEWVDEEVRGRIFGIKEWVVSLAFLISTVVLGVLAETVARGKLAYGFTALLIFLATLGLAWVVRNRRF